MGGWNKEGEEKEKERGEASRRLCSGWMSFSAGALARVEGEGAIWQLCSGRGGGVCGVCVCVLGG